ncbi:MAG: glycosyltransferase family A protein, partial [Bacteroidota bacterium]
IIPTFNRAKLLEKCIQSVLAQQLTNWELLIIDDGSTDTTREVIQSFADKRIAYHFQEKAERSQARNRGIDLARAEHLCFIDDDDYVLPNYLSDFYRAIESGEKTTILRTGFYYEFGEERKQAPIYRKEYHHHPVQFALWEMVGVVSLCIPKAYLREDRFPDFPHWQDSHLILRLLAKYPFSQLDNCTYIYVQHKKMGTHQIFNSDEQIESRLQLTLSAIDDFFQYHQSLIATMVQRDTHRAMRSAKMMHYAVAAAARKNRKKARELLHRSIKAGLYKRHWRLYLAFCKRYFLS